jgi:Cu/Ag efflux protein CusF
MKFKLLALASVAIATLSHANAADDAAATPPQADAPATSPKSHPLRGVITSVQEERSAIMVKHEEIPGVMRAMTMLFHLDATTLKKVKKGQTITAMLSRRGDEWWLDDVKVVPEKKS